MEKRGISTLFLVILAIVIIAIAGIVYYYTTKEKVILTPEEAKTASSLDLSPKEFKEVQQKAEEFFKEVAPFYDQSALDYSKIDDIKTIERDKSLDLELKPNPKVVIIQYTWSSPSPYIIYLIENGDIKVLVQESYPEGELS